MSVVRRLDSGSLRKPQLQANGWLRVDGFVSRTGVFTYGMPDGTKRREWRPPEEVFKADSLATFDMVPVTDNHPPEFLTAENTSKYSKGAVSAPRADGDKVAAVMLVTDAELVAKLQAGIDQVSCGYVCDLEDASGVTPQGERYDAIQRNIRGNHVAIVPLGRAGPEVRVRMDAAGLDDDAAPPPAPSATKGNQMSKIRIDGVDFDPSTEAFAQALQKRDERMASEAAALKAQVTAATEKADKAEARADAAAEALEKAQAEIKELPAKLRADMAARAELDAKARAVLGKDAKLDSLTPIDVRRLVLSKLAPEVKLDGKSEAYVEARFDAAIEASEKADGQWEREADKLESDKRSVTDTKKVDADEARAEFLKASQQAWKKPLSSSKSS